MKGRKPRPQLPTDKQTAMLRRIKRGKLVATFVNGEKSFSYEDGSPASYGDAMKLIQKGWVKPEDPGLIGDEPQSWVIREPA